MAVVKITATQTADLVNLATRQFLGEDGLTLAQDLSNVIDMGTAIANANAYESFVEKILLGISKIIFVDRKYTGSAPDVYRDNFEYGLITQKVRGVLPEAKANQSWQVTSGTSYDDNVYEGHIVEAKIFKNIDAFEIRQSITNEQLKTAFTSAQELGNFVSMLMTLVQNSLELKTESLIMMTINNFTAEVLHAEGTGSSTTSPRAVNLLYEYNTLKGSSLTQANCLFDTGFLKYATGVMKRYKKLLSRYSTIYNQNAKQNHTPQDKLHIVLLDYFVENADTYLQSDTWHNEFTQLPKFESVTAWQGVGTDGSLTDLSTIKVKTASGNTVNVDGVIGVMFDHDALGITKDQPSVETKYIRSAQFTNYWYKEVNSYFNDLDENFVVFYIG